METALFVFVYLVGVPFAAGVIGEKCGKGDWIFAAVIAAMSWIGTGLFLGMMLVMYLGVRFQSLSRDYSSSGARLILAPGLPFFSSICAYAQPCKPLAGRPANHVNSMHFRPVGAPSFRPRNRPNRCHAPVCSSVRILRG